MLPISPAAPVINIMALYGTTKTSRTTTGLGWGARQFRSALLPAAPGCRPRPVDSCSGKRSLVNRRPERGVLGRGAERSAHTRHIEPSASLPVLLQALRMPLTSDQLPGWPGADLDLTMSTKVEFAGGSVYGVERHSIEVRRRRGTHSLDPVPIELTADRDEVHSGVARSNLPLCRSFPADRVPRPRGTGGQERRVAPCRRPGRGAPPGRTGRGCEQRTVHGAHIDAPQRPSGGWRCVLKTDSYRLAVRGLPASRRATRRMSVYQYPSRALNQLPRALARATTK